MNSIEFVRPPLVDASRLDPNESIASPGDFKPVSAEELRHGFETDQVFRDFFSESQGPLKETNERWLRDLANVVNQKMALVPNNMKGCELMFRFRKTYGEVHHMAQATVWRNQEGRLQMGFAHQESIPRDKKHYRGRVFSTFDTRAVMNGRNPPVLDSLLKQGLPDVRVLPCAAPENVSLASWLSNEPCEHPYGFDGHEDAQGFHALTCFNITYTVHCAVHGRETGVDTAPTVPHGVKLALCTYFGEASYERYRQFTHQGRTYDVESLPAKDLVKGFLFQGTTWGDHERWDVQPRPAVTLRPKF